MVTARSFRMLLLGVMAAVAACTPRTGAPAPSGQSVADFYRGKTVTIIVGLAPGGGFDTTARVLAKHMGDHIPGNPNIVVENMEGAGSLILANHIYNVARPDGLTIGEFNEQQILSQATGIEGVQFDARKFGWLGNAQKTTQICSIRSDSPYTGAQDLFRRELPPLVVGATGPGSDGYDFPKLLSAVLGANFRVVSGYGGTAPTRLATESHEVDGLCWTWESLVSTAPNWLETNFVNVVVYQASEPKPQIEERFPNARRAEDLATDEQSKALIRAGAGTTSVAKPFVVPPGVPPDRLSALQTAFIETLKDPATLADAAEIKLDLDPNPAVEAERIVNSMLSLPPELAARLAEIRKG
jgi:Tripartite tricarboxylate transporter family receptor